MSYLLFTAMTMTSSTGSTSSSSNQAAVPDRSTCTSLRKDYVGNVGAAHYNDKSTSTVKTKDGNIIFTTKKTAECKSLGE
jgi:hypothetical protein